MKPHFGTPGVFSYPGQHTIKKKNKDQIGKGRMKSRFNIISPIAATDQRMKAKAGVKRKKNTTVKKNSNKKKKTTKQSSI